VPAGPQLHNQVSAADAAKYYDKYPSIAVAAGKKRHDVMLGKNRGKAVDGDPMQVDSASAAAAGPAVEPTPTQSSGCAEKPEVPKFAPGTLSADYVEQHKASLAALGSYLGVDLWGLVQKPIEGAIATPPVVEPSETQLFGTLKKSRHELEQANSRVEKAVAHLNNKQKQLDEGLAQKLLRDEDAAVCQSAFDEAHSAYHRILEGRDDDEVSVSSGERTPRVSVDDMDVREIHEHITKQGEKVEALRVRQQEEYKKLEEAQGVAKEKMRLLSAPPAPAPPPAKKPRVDDEEVFPSQEGTQPGAEGIDGTGSSGFVPVRAPRSRRTGGSKGDGGKGVRPITDSESSGNEGRRHRRRSRSPSKEQQHDKEQQHEGNTAEVGAGAEGQVPDPGLPPPPVQQTVAQPLAGAACG